MELKDIIKDYKYRHQLTNDEIAQKLGVTKSTVSRWISGDVKRIQDETLKRLNELLGYDIEPVIKGKSIHLKRPILGYAKAGYDMYGENNYMGEEEVTEEDFYKVIDKMTECWLSNGELEQYLRPITLFGDNFDSYLNEDWERQETDWQSQYY